MLNKHFLYVIFYTYTLISPVSLDSLDSPVSLDSLDSLDSPP